MATNKILLATTQLPIKAEINVLTMSDDQIMNTIYATHVHGDEKFDVDSLFVVTENILQRATHLVENVVLGTKEHQENLEEKAPKASFSPPSCTLRALSCEMACKAPAEEIAHKTTMSILNKLAHYSWDAKALHSSDQLAKSVGILKRVPVVVKRPGLKKYGKAIIELNSLIKATLEVIESIFELEKLSIYDTKDVPALSGALDRIPVDVYWAIITIVACTTKLCCITGDEGKTQELSPFAQKINVILNVLRRTIKLAHEQIDVIEAYRKLKKIFQTPTEVMEVFKALIFPKDVEPSLIDGSTNKLVNIEVLRKKNVLFFISSLEITIEEISVLKPVYDEISKKDQYKIVWIPIVEQWTDDLKKKFDVLRFDSKMPWYTVQYFSPVVGIKFIKEEWNFRNKPLVVVISPKGKVEHPNAFYIINYSGCDQILLAWRQSQITRRGNSYFSYSTIYCTLKQTSYYKRLMRLIKIKISIIIIKDDKYIFFYGGKDNEWIQQFTKKATILANDPALKEAGISIESVHIGKNEKGQHDVGILDRFWDKMESFFFINTEKKTEPDSVTKEIHKILSYKNESGWVVLSKGSKVIFTGHGTTILKVVDEAEKWKGYVREIGFEIIFKQYHDKVIEVNRPCSRVDIPVGVGKIPEHMHCPGCPASWRPILVLSAATLTVL
ncbi:hypothetical protein CIPAW_01G191700 [Carya illinoinensis]|uniref:Sieve element occlusion n=1 Tax=Carya illinoinensis TaxID=32201 RepID=A0A8T1RPN2_CARIL|nr:hypothetical protein CIPAW_01G191700 [Carya illinoinensis]